MSISDQRFAPGGEGPQRSNRYGLLGAIQSILRGGWFEGLFKPEEQGYLTRLLLQLYGSHDGGLLVRKSTAMYSMGIKDSRTAQRYVQIAEEKGLLRIVQSEVDQRVDFLLPTAKLLSIVEKEIDKFERRMFEILDDDRQDLIGSPPLVALGAKKEEKGLISSCDETIKYFPKNAEAYRRRAYAHWDAGDAEKALADCAQAIELDPSKARYIELRAMMRQQLGNIAAARADFDLVIKMVPWPRAVARRARFFLELEQYAEAVNDLTLAIELEDNGKRRAAHLARYFVFRAEAFDNLQRESEAEGDRRSARQIEPDLARLLIGTKHKSLV
jgi:tetratricopeptide (TPR) repeat protein